MSALLNSEITLFIPEDENSKFRYIWKMNHSDSGTSGSGLFLRLGKFPDFFLFFCNLIFEPCNFFILFIYFPV